jgi:hypothetical protein
MDAETKEKGRRPSSFFYMGMWIPYAEYKRQQQRRPATSLGAPFNN